MVTEDNEVPKAAIFDLDGTLLDSVDLHALAWKEAMEQFGHDVTFERVRSQIGKGGDKLVPVFLSKDQQRENTARSSRSGAVNASNLRICHSFVPSRWCRNSCGVFARPVCASP